MADDLKEIVAKGLRSRKRRKLPKRIVDIPVYLVSKKVFGPKVQRGNIRVIQSASGNKWKIVVYVHGDLELEHLADAT